jgi:hypothetical protein
MKVKHLVKYLRRIILAVILGFMCLLLVPFIIPTSWLFTQERQSKGCEEFCRMLEVRLVIAKMELVDGESKIVVVPNRLRADKCVITKPYGGPSYAELTALGISPKAARVISHPIMTEGCGIFFLKDDKIICEGHTRYAYSAPKVLVCDIGAPIKLTVQFDPAYADEDWEIHPTAKIMLITKIE